MRLRIALRANVELPAEFQAVRRVWRVRRGSVSFGVSVVASRVDAIRKQEQYEAYKALAEAAGSDGAMVRLFDVGGEIGNEVRSNASATRRSACARSVSGCEIKHVMRTQVRAILRAAAAGRLSLVIPMVADVADMRRRKTSDR